MVWMHNGYWLFDSHAAIIDIARDKKIDLAETVLFFYEDPSTPKYRGHRLPRVT